MKKLSFSIFIIALVLFSGCTFLTSQQGPTLLNTTEPDEVTTPEITTVEPVTPDAAQTWQGEGFSFTYPAIYTADEQGLWDEERYELHMNPPENCEVCSLPSVEVKTSTTDQTLDQYILADFDLPGETLDEMSQETGIQYDQILMGDNAVTHIRVDDMFAITGYYIQKGTTILSFKVYFDEDNNDELAEILSSLKFE
ncbi:MAG: hypothetical protein WC882_03310 [Candidatus Gracilibacteria bacterium]